MYQVLGPKFIVVVTAWLSLSVLSLLAVAGMPSSMRIIVAVVDLLILTVLFANPIWRFLWNKTGVLGRWLSQKVYPDLNGTYDVILESNWPIVKRMLDASRKDAKRFDPFDLDEPAPALEEIHLEAKIEQTWFEIKVWMYPRNSSATISQSRTLITIPIKASETGEKELIFIFQQENNRRAPTDDLWHEGAARLVISRDDPKQLSGEYWNSRSWHRGINTAGRIRLVRSEGASANAAR